MRFRELRIPAYGAFTDWRVDLTGGAGCLEILYGPNEAGKSTLLRAISALLFGFPVKTDDAFLHPYGELRVGATIEHEGRVLRCLRRKGNKNTLRDGADAALVTDEELLAVAPVASAVVFESMFGLNAQRLTEGGAELLAGRGEFGQMLFAAAAGIENLHSILTGLSDEADALFKARASSPRISRLLAEFAEQRRRVKDGQVTTRELEEVRAARAQSAAELEQVRAELTAVVAEESRLGRIRSAVGLLGQRRLAQAELDEVGAVVALRAEFAEEFEKARRAVAVGEASRSSVRVRVEQLRSEIEGIEYSEDLLARSAEIEALYQRLGAEQKALADLPKLKGQAAALEAELRGLLAELQEPAELEDVERLRVPAHEAKLAARLAAECAGLQADWSNAARQAEELRVEVEQDEARLAALPAARAVAGLEAALRRETLPEAKRRELAGRVAALETRIEDEVRLLPWPGSVEELLGSALPAEAVVEAWRLKLEAAAAAVREAERARAEAQRELQRHELSLRRLEAGRAIATELELTARRAEREQEWQAVRRVWLEGVAEPEPARLAERYAGTVRAADEVVDDLRAHAKEAAQAAGARLEIELAREKEAVRSVELRQRSEDLLALQAEWAVLWQGWPVVVSEPLQMADWLRRRTAVAGRVDELDALRRQVVEAEGAEAAAGEELRQAIGDGAEGSTVAMRQRAAALVEEQRRLASERQNLEEHIAGTRKKLAVVRSRASQAKAEIDGWLGRWAELVGRLQLSGALEPAAVQELLQLRGQVLARHAEYVTAKTRIQSIERDSGRFEQDARRVAGEAWDEARGEGGSKEVVRRLYQDLASQRKARDLAVSRRADLVTEMVKLNELDVEMARLEAQLAALVREAGCAEALEVPARLEGSARRRAVLQRLSEIQEALAGVAAGRAIEELEEEARGAAPDDIPARMAECEARRAELGGRRDALIRAESEKDRDLASLEGRTDARDAAADLQTTRAALLEETERFVRLKLAGQLLRKAIDEFRRKSTGQLLSRASEIFAGLTQGSFGGLRLDYGSDSEDEMVLVGMRPDGKPVGVMGMSEGTCDQLYLALRLASLEVYFEKNPAVPLIADDILVHFDDARAAAALQALAGLAGHTQVLLFTHHRHLVELAQAHLAPEQFVTYRLDRVAAAG